MQRLCHNLSNNARKGDYITIKKLEKRNLETGPREDALSEKGRETMTGS